MKMSDISKRRDLAADPNLCGIIYNTVNFCDFYAFEYARLKSTLKVPVLNEFKTAHSPPNTEYGWG